MVRPDTGVSPSAPPEKALITVKVGVAAIVMLRSAVVDTGGVSESWTCTVKFAVPTVVGIPAMAPLLVRVRPGGSEPATGSHAYGDKPPVADKVMLYDAPTVPPGSEVVVIETTPAITVMLRFAVAMAELASLTCTTKA